MCDFAERMEKQGIEQGIERGIKAVIETCFELQVSKEETQARIVQKFQITKDEAAEYMTQYFGK